jgi:hypothetical protein
VIASSEFVGTTEGGALTRILSNRTPAYPGVDRLDFERLAQLFPFGKAFLKLGAVGGKFAGLAFGLF